MCVLLTEYSVMIKRLVVTSISLLPKKTEIWKLTPQTPMVVRSLLYQINIICIQWRIQRGVPGVGTPPFLMLLNGDEWLETPPSLFKMAGSAPGRFDKVIEVLKNLTTYWTLTDATVTWQNEDRYVLLSWHKCHRLNKNETVHDG